MVQQRHPLILDTAGRQPAILDRARAITQDAGGRLKIIRCTAPSAVRQARLAARSAGPSQWTNDQTTDAQERAWFAHLPPETLILASEQPLDRLLPLALDFIQA